MAKKIAPPKRRRSPPGNDEGFRFHAARVDSLFTVLDAPAFVDSPDAAQIAQFAGIDPRTAGKLLQNALTLGLVEKIGDKQYALALPYPFKGSKDQKEAVVREALVRLPLVTSIRQFMQLGDNIETATRKAATVTGIRDYDPKHFTPLLEWSKTLGVLKAGVNLENLLDRATEAKEKRKTELGQVIAFLSHSSKDKPFIRQLAGDLTAESVGVWLDEQKIRVGDSIPEVIAQGLAESDFFLVAISEHSVNSPWVRKELNDALVHEIERRRVTVLPLRLDDTPMPEAIKGKKYADFSRSYNAGLVDLLKALKGS